MGDGERCTPAAPARDRRARLRQGADAGPRTARDGGRAGSRRRVAAGRGGRTARAAAPRGVTSKLACTLEPDERADVQPRRILQRAARGDRGEPAGHARRHRQRVPARPARGRAAHALAAARSSRASSRPSRSRTSARSSAGSSRSPGPTPRPRRLPARVRRLRAALPEQRRPDLEPLRDLLVERRRARAAPHGARAALAARRRAARRLARVPRPALGGAERGDRPDAGAPGRASWPATRIARGLPADGQGGHARSTTRARPRRCTTCARQGKELRYLLEFFAQPLSRARSIKPMVRDAQGAAGHARPLPGPRGPGATLLRSLGDEVATLDDGAAALMAMGLLVDRLEARAGRARAPSSPSASPPSPPSRSARLVRETFA